jgi:hypothetical protein
MKRFQKEAQLFVWIIGQDLRRNSDKGEDSQSYIHPFFYLSSPLNIRNHFVEIVKAKIKKNVLKNKRSFNTSYFSHSVNAFQYCSFEHLTDISSTISSLTVVQSTSKNKTKPKNRTGSSRQEYFSHYLLSKAQ